MTPHTLDLNEWRHIAPRAVFILQRAIEFFHHQSHHIVNKVAILLQLSLGVEPPVNDEVQIAVLGDARRDFGC